MLARRIARSLLALQCGARRLGGGPSGPGTPVLRARAREPGDAFERMQAALEHPSMKTGNGLVLRELFLLQMVRAGWSRMRACGCVGVVTHASPRAGGLHEFAGAPGVGG